MAYRLYRREPTFKGKYYYSVVCRGCKRHIPIADDKSNGEKPINFTGDEKLSIPCVKCAHDDIYQASDVKSVRAKHNQIGARPERIKISKSSRKPLWKNYPDAKVVLGIGYIEDRPKAAAIVGRIITSWADIEVQCARLLAELMGTNVPAAAAVFGSLRSSRTQHDALNAAAQVVLDKKDLDLFRAYMARKKELESERNDLTHGCFGVSVKIPDHVVWVSQSDYLNFSAVIKSDNSNETKEHFRRKQFVYELGTLERIAQEIEEFYHQIGFFTGYLTARHDGQSGEHFRVIRYPQLCNQSHIEQALTLIQRKESK